MDNFAIIILFLTISTIISYSSYFELISATPAQNSSSDSLSIPRINIFSFSD